MLAAVYCELQTWGEARISRGMVRLDSATHHGRGGGSPREQVCKRVGGVFREF